MDQEIPQTVAAVAVAAETAVGQPTVVPPVTGEANAGVGSAPPSGIERDVAMVPAEQGGGTDEQNNNKSAPPIA